MGGEVGAGALGDEGAAVVGFDDEGCAVACAEVVEEGDGAVGVGVFDGMGGEGGAGGEVADGEDESVAAVDGRGWFGVVHGPDGAGAMPGDGVVPGGRGAVMVVAAGEVEEAGEVTAGDGREVVLEGGDGQGGAEEGEEVADLAALGRGGGERRGAERARGEAIVGVVPAALPLLEGGGGHAECGGDGGDGPSVPARPAGTGEDAAADLRFERASGTLAVGAGDMERPGGAQAESGGIGQESGVGVAAAAAAGVGPGQRAGRRVLFFFRRGPRTASSSTRHRSSSRAISASFACVRAAASSARSVAVAGSSNRAAPAAGLGPGVRGSAAATAPARIWSRRTNTYERSMPKAAAASSMVQVPARVDRITSVLRLASSLPARRWTRAGPVVGRGMAVLGLRPRPQDLSPEPLRRQASPREVALPGVRRLRHQPALRVHPCRALSSG